MTFKLFSKIKSFGSTLSPYIVWALVPAVSAALVLAVFTLWHVKKSGLSNFAGAAFRQKPSPQILLHIKAKNHALKMVGLPGFEPGSRAPEAQSLDHASRQPHFMLECLLCLMLVLCRFNKGVFLTFKPFIWAITTITAIEEGVGRLV